MEVCKDITGYNGLYRVSDNGCVYRNSKPLKPRNNCRGNGYLKVAIFLDGKRKDSYIHRLVYETFNSKIKKGFEINHIDGDTKNNKLSNLEMITHTENIRHAFKLGLVNTLKGEKHLKHKLTEIQVKDIRTKFKTGLYNYVSLAKEFNVHSSNIGYIINNKIWKHI